MMCVGALVHARIERLVFGATEPKAGAVVTHPLLNQDWLNHQISITDGVLEHLCSHLISQFFANRREQKGAPLA